MSERQQKIWVVVGVVVAGMIAYANSFGGSFIFDDKPTILANPNIRHLWPLTKVLTTPPYTTVRGRPVVSLTVALNYAVSGYEVWSYHIFNLVIHILAGLMLYVIVRRTLLCDRLKDRFGNYATILAGAAAAIWLVHPIQTQSVTYIVQRAESLMGLFYLFTLYSAIRVMQSGRSAGWLVLSIVCCALGMATKEAMATAPVLVLLYDRTFFTGTFRGSLRQRWGLYAGMAATWVILGVLMWTNPHTDQTEGFTIVASLYYAMNQGIVILRYLRLAVWPVGLCIDYGWPLETNWMRLSPPLLAILSLLAITIWGVVRNRSWSYPAAWFFAVLAPTSSFMPLWHPIYEHRIYLSLAGVAVLAVIGGYALIERAAKRFTVIERFGRLTGFLLAAVVVGVFTLLTLLRNNDYRSSESIWRSALRVSPFNAGAYNGLGVALAAQGRDIEAMECYLRTVYIDPCYVDGYYNLGNAYNRLGRYEEAIEAYKTAIEKHSGYIEAYHNLSMVYCQLGRWQDAAEACKSAIRVRPDYVEAHYGLGLCYIALGEKVLALEEYKILKTLNSAWADELFAQIPR
jgi:tetratricopeptide (TPR) repeat protein